VVSDAPPVWKQEIKMNATTHFQRDLVEKGLIPNNTDPRHIEAFIRLQYNTVNQLDWRTIKREVKIGLACIKEGGVIEAEKLTLSFGL
jgi:hypothetical protein